MSNFHKILFLAGFLILIDIESVEAQCSGQDTLIYGFNNPNGLGAFIGFLCAGADSVGTTGANGYYNGDGYIIKLVAGSQVTFSINNCNGAAVSLTIADSSKNIITGAYAVAACTNTLNFTAPYTGSFIVFINLNGICNIYGNTLIGQANVKIQPGTQVPACPVSNIINDTICGSIPLTINATFEQGNSAEALSTDPLDGYVISRGYVCSPPNNTLWYSFTAPSDIDTINIWFTSKTGNGFHSWLGIFLATDPNNSCSGGLVFKNCAEGPDDNSGIDTVNISLTGILAGQVYYFMVDGYNGDAGGFSIAIRSQPFLNSVNELNALRNYFIFPNPANNNIQINSAITNDATIIFYNSVGEIVFKKEYDNFLNEKIDVSFFSPGFYQVRIINSKSDIRMKLIIE